MGSNKEMVEHWRRHIDEFSNSGLTRRAYCQKNGIRVYQLDYWRRKLKALQTKSSPNIMKDWVPLQIREEPPADQSSKIRLRVDRFAIETDPGIKPELLSQVLRVIGSPC